MLLHGVARRLHGARVSHGLARALAVGVLGLAAIGIATGVFVLLHGFLRGKLGDLPALLDSTSGTLGSLRDRLAEVGISLPAFGGDDAAQGAAAWLKEHAERFRSAGKTGARGLAHALVGAILGTIVFFGAPGTADRPFAAALMGRLERFDEAFRRVARAQMEIAAINTVLTAMYIFGALPLFGIRLPLSGTLVLLTFLCGLVPVVGNIFSNTMVVLTSLTVSPWVAVASLVYLVVIHKLEYILNAKIVGGRIGAAVWETLLAIVVFEAAFGIPGIVLAPVVYAWIRTELKERGLV